MYWKKWFKKNWWILLLPIIVPAGIIILKYVNKISEIKGIIEKENLHQPQPNATLLAKDKGDIIFLNRCFDCGKEYEITSLNPIKFESAPEIEEDWGE